MSISPICKPINKGIYLKNNVNIYNFTPFELRKIFCRAPTSLVLTRLSQIKEHLKIEMIKKTQLNNVKLSDEMINNDIEQKINTSLENIKYEIFEGNIYTLSKGSINFLRLLFYTINVSQFLID
jgi:hypothetical protein